MERLASTSVLSLSSCRKHNKQANSWTLDEAVQYCDCFIKPKRYNQNSIKSILSVSLMSKQGHAVSNIPYPLKRSFFFFLNNSILVCLILSCFPFLSFFLCFVQTVLSIKYLSRYSKSYGKGIKYTISLSY